MKKIDQLCSSKAEAKFTKKAIWLLLGFFLPIAVALLGIWWAVENGHMEKSSIKGALIGVGMVAVFLAVFVLSKWKGVVTVLMIASLLSLPTPGMAQATSGGPQVKVMTVSVRVDQNGKADLSSIPSDLPAELRAEIANAVTNASPGEAVVVAPEGVDASVYASEIAQAKAQAATLAKTITTEGLTTSSGGPTTNLVWWAAIIVIIVIIIVVAVIIYVLIKLTRMIPKGPPPGGENPGLVGKSSIGPVGSFGGITMLNLTPAEQGLPQVSIMATNTSQPFDYVLEQSTNLVDWTEACSLSFTNFGWSAVTNVGTTNYNWDLTLVVSTNGATVSQYTLSTPVKSAATATFEMPEPIRVSEPGSMLPMQFFRLTPVPAK